jgi:hypothetical protein
MLPKFLNTEECEEIYHYCHECYGLEPQHWSEYVLLKKKEGLWIVPKNYFIKWQSVAVGPDVNPEGQGLRVLSGKSFPYKITYGFYQVFSSQISKRLIEVSENQARTLLKRGVLEGIDKKGLNFGYYIATYQGRFIGIMLLGKEGWVSQVPKSFSSQLSKDLEISYK